MICGTKVGFVMFKQLLIFFPFGNNQRIVANLLSFHQLVSFYYLSTFRIHGFKLDGGSTWTFQLPTNAK